MLNDIHAIHVGQPKVSHQKVKLARPELIQGSLSCVGHIHLVSFFTHHHLKSFGYIHLIFHQKDMGPVGRLTSYGFLDCVHDLFLLSFVFTLNLAREMPIPVRESIGMIGQ